MAFHWQNCTLIYCCVYGFLWYLKIEGKEHQVAEELLLKIE